MRVFLRSLWIIVSNARGARPITDDMVERGARALCWSMTGDPDLVDDDDRHHARTVLTDALDEGLR